MISKEVDRVSQIKLKKVQNNNNAKVVMRKINDFNMKMPSKVHNTTINLPEKNNTYEISKTNGGHSFAIVTKDTKNLETFSLEKNDKKNFIENQNDPIVLESIDGTESFQNQENIPNNEQIERFADLIYEQKYFKFSEKSDKFINVKKDENNYMGYND